jgi:hypothetical protein
MKKASKKDTLRLVCVWKANQRMLAFGLGSFLIIRGAAAL